MTADRIPPIQPTANASDGAHDEIDLRQMFAVLWGGKFKLLLAVLITLALGALYLIAKAPVYETNGLVQVEQDNNSLSSSLGGSDLSALLGAPVQTEAEIEILQSRMVLNKVIDNLKLDIQAGPNYFPLIGRFIAQHRGTPGQIAPALLGMSRFAWSGELIDVSSFAVPPSLLDQSLTLVAGSKGAYTLLGLDGAPLLQGHVGETATAKLADGNVELFVKDLQAAAGTHFTVTHFARQDVLYDLSQALTIAEQTKDSGVIGITYDGKSPQAVTNVIREIEDAYLRQNVERRSAEAQQSLDFLQQQLPAIKAKVDAAQAGLNAYQMKQGSIDITKETDLVLQTAVDLGTQRLELEQKRQEALQRFTPNHPVIQGIDAQIREIDNRETDLKKRTEALPETQQEILSLMRDLEVNTGLYTALLNSAQQLQIAKAGTVGNVRIIDYPLAPIDPAKPKPVFVLAISLVVGLMFGVGYILIEKALFRGVSSPDEVEKALGLPTYAAIPFTPAQEKMSRGFRQSDKKSHILATAQPENVAIEALRSLRTSLQFALLESGNNIVMFSGPTQGLGKSFVSINLGAVLATSGKRVLVIDADLRRGYLHRYFGESAAPGLSDYIAGNADMASVIKKTAVDGLFLLTNGTTPPNPSELLLHEKFNQLLQNLSKNFDYVLIDTPPVLPVTDACIVGRVAGNVLLVLKEGEHSMNVIEETIRRMRNAGVNPRGILFNQVGVRGGGYGYYSSYSYAYKQEYSSTKR
ncbi:polysaccharide biosynthesis tyrosine autokinase [Solimonas terrae]|uniref:Polysaccharide biosynthesis tyrosine autokinase n=1 Tax=Solimonas terrae TaxID=1396819 RepID=A0A6M2BR14_9GAMM|nr:polysaccharide biosynthesis tyrosine autokinase [Solimonas terrae]NGY04523.1 polysaccharide biosynthesis tyrosine autokinase [Solimonas terrae]